MIEVSTTKETKLKGMSASSSSHVAKKKKSGRSSDIVSDIARSDCSQYSIRNP